MPISEKKKASNAKWDRENMTTLGCKIRREQAVAFKSYCESQGKTSNTALKDYVMGCIGPQSAAAPQPSFISPDTLETAQTAAEAAGEAVPVFIHRAVSETAERDNAAQPPTEDKAD